MTNKWWVYLLLGLAGSPSLLATTVPVAVSPGSPAEPDLIESRCPTFIWSAVEDAKGYELVVYAIVGDEESRPVLERRFVGSVFAWTPPLERCLERGRRYGWSVRAIGRRNASDWSTPTLFQVVSGPSRTEFEAAFLVVRQYLSEGEPRDPKLTGTSADMVVLSERGRPQGGTAAAESGTGTLTVEGEVRTVDSSSAPRQWGRGRPRTDVYLEDTTPRDLCKNGSVRFGLSLTTVEWGSAADACPAGTWVCTVAERGSGSCDTLRPRFDWLACDGTPHTPSVTSQTGWLADADPDILEPQSGVCGNELGELGTCAPCVLLPVWCCSE